MCFYNIFKSWIQIVYKIIKKIDIYNEFVCTNKYIIEMLHWFIFRALINKTKEGGGGGPKKPYSFILWYIKLHNLNCATSNPAISLLCHNWKFETLKTISGVLFGTTMKVWVGALILLFWCDHFTLQYWILPPFPPYSTCLGGSFVVN